MTGASGTDRPRFLVLENHSSEQVMAAARELAGDRARLQPGWRGGDRPNVHPVVLVGSVRSAGGAAQAVLAAVGGAELVVDASAPRDVIDSLCEDLRHLGRLDHRLEAPAEVPLDETERALLAMLLGGATLGQAARALHLSRRTADRRLSSAKLSLDAQTTSAAVSAAARLGIRPVTPGSPAGS